MFKDSFILISFVGAIAMAIPFVVCFIRFIQGKKPFPWSD